MNSESQKALLSEENQWQSMTVDKVCGDWAYLNGQHQADQEVDGFETKHLYDTSRLMRQMNLTMKLDGDRLNNQANRQT